jgi:CheY-like chemotaxis protein
MDSDLLRPGAWPGYDLACVQCGSGVRSVDRFCSQCGREDPTGANDAMLLQPTIVVDSPSAFIEAPTFVSTDGVVETPNVPEEPVEKTAMKRSKLAEIQQKREAELRALLVPNAVFGRRYRVQRFLGSGAMGFVCSAIDESIDEVVALKILSAPMQEDPDAFERFKLELKLARKIRHRNVVQSFDLGFADGYPYISMEYIDADNMLKHLHRKGPMEEMHALAVLRQVLRGLRAAHDLGIIHRDIKPENILLNKDRIAFITDFGIATPANLGKTRELAGTPDYMAPEQLRMEPVTPASDIYSSGVLFYRMLTGNLPYKCETITQIMDAHLHAAPDEIPDELPISWETRELVDWMLRKSVAERPPNAQPLLDRIDAMMKEGVSSKRTRSTAGTRVTVLIVEDDETQLAFMRAALEADGFRVVPATNARQGVELAFEQNPSIILLDAKIRGGFDLGDVFDDPTGVDGLGFCRILRGDSKLRDVPIIVMTDNTLSMLQPAFEVSGAADIIIKPLSADDVVGAVRRTLPKVTASLGGS